MRKWAKQEIYRKERKSDQSKHRSRRSRVSRLPYDKLRRFAIKFMQVLKRDTLTERVRKTAEGEAAVLILKNGVHLSNSYSNKKGQLSTVTKHSNNKMEERRTSVIKGPISPAAQKNVDVTTTGINKIEAEKGNTCQQNVIIDLLARHIMNQINNPDDAATISSIQNGENEIEISDFTKIFSPGTKHLNSELEPKKYSNIAEILCINLGEKDEKLQHHTYTKTVKRKLDAEYRKAKIKKNAVSEKICKINEISEKLNKYSNIVSTYKYINSNTTSECAKAALVSVPKLNRKQIVQEVKDISYNLILDSLQKIGTCITPSATKNEMPKNENLTLLNKSEINQERNIKINQNPLQYCKENNVNVLPSNHLSAPSNETKIHQCANFKQPEEHKDPKPSLIPANIESSQDIGELDIDLRIPVHDYEIAEACNSHLDLQDSRKVRIIKDKNEKPKLRISQKYQQNVNVTEYAINDRTENPTTQTYTNRSRTWYLPPEPTFSTLTVNGPLTNKQNWPREIDPSQAPIPVIVQMSRNNDDTNITQQQQDIGILMTRKNLSCCNCEKTTMPTACSNLGHLQTSQNRNGQLQNQLVPKPNNKAHQPIKKSFITKPTACRKSQQIHKNKSSAIEIINATQKCDTPVSNPFSPVLKPAPYIPSARKPMSCSLNEEKVLQENFLRTLISLGLDSIPTEKTSYSSNEVTSTTFFDEGADIMKSSSVVGTNFEAKRAKNLSLPKFAEDNRKIMNMFDKSNCSNSNMWHNDREQVPTPPKLDVSQKLSSSDYHSSNNENISIPAAPFQVSSDLVINRLAGVSQNPLNSPNSKSLSEKYSKILNVLHNEINPSNCAVLGSKTAELGSTKAHTKYSSLGSKVTADSATLKVSSSNHTSSEETLNNIIKADLPSKQEHTCNQNLRTVKCLDQKLEHKLSLSSNEIPLATALYTPFDSVNFILTGNSGSEPSLPATSPFTPTNILNSSTDLAEKTIKQPKTSKPKSISQKLQKFSSTGSQMPNHRSHSPSSIFQIHSDITKGSLPSSSAAITRTNNSPVSYNSKLNTDVIIKSLHELITSKPCSTSKNHASSNSSKPLRYDPLSISKTARSILRKKSLKEPLPSPITTKLRIIHNDPVSGFGVKVNRLRPCKP